MRLVLSSAIVALLTVAGCRSHSNDDISSEHVYEVDMTKIDADSVGYSMFADSVEYVDLEITNESMISRIGDIEITDSAIVVCDSRQGAVMLFDRIGNFSRRIGQRGEGPEEYLAPLRIDADGERIYVYDRWRQGVMKYDYSGRFEGLDSIGPAEDIAILGQGRYLVADFNSSEGSGVYVVTTDPYRRNLIAKRRDPVDRTHMWEFYRSGSGLTVMSSDFENRLYRYAGDSLVAEVRFAISPVPSADDLASWKREDLMEHFAGTGHIDTGRWHIGIYSRYPDIRYVILDRSNGSLMLSAALKNDIDGVAREDFAGSTRDGDMVMTVAGVERDSNPRLQIIYMKE